MNETLIVIGSVVALYALAARRLSTTVITGPIVFTAVGVAIGPEGLDGALRSACGQDLHTMGLKPVDDGGQSFLVEDRNQGAADGSLHGFFGSEKPRN